MTRAVDGSALLVTLFFIVLILGVVLAFLSSARAERATAKAYMERMRAEELANGALASSVALLRKETAFRYQVVGKDGTRRWQWRHYVTMPGGLIVPPPPVVGASAGAAQSQLTQFVPLSSGKPTVAEWPDAFLEPASLNVPTFFNDAGRSRLLTDRLDADGQPVPMHLKWVYVRESRQGSPDQWTRELDFDELPDLTDTTKPIVGRYAWWVDDESAKVNYNLAWKRDPGPRASVHPNPSRPAHPSRINLMGLMQRDGTFATEAIADAIFRWRDRSPNRPFNSFADARQASPLVADILEFNKFELTHYNHDPDTIFTGEDRILLTTRRDLVPKLDGVYARRFLDLLRDDTDISRLDPGVLEDIAGGQQDWRADPTGGVVLPNKFDTVVRTLVRYLREQHWPINDGQSFREKYYPGSTEHDPRIAQLAVNIIDYVRAKESRLSVVAPLSYGIDERGRYTLHADWAYGSPRSGMGVTRAPYITEMAMHVGASPVTAPEGSEVTPDGWPMNNGAPVPLYPCTFKVELFLPANYQIVDSAGMTGFDLVPVKALPIPAGAQRCWFLTFGETLDATRGYYAVAPGSGKMVKLSSHATGALPILKSDIVGSTILRPGKRVTITKTVYREQPYAAASAAAMRTVLHQGTTGDDGLLLGPLNRWAPVSAAPQSSTVPYQIGNPEMVSAETMRSVETDDPRCNTSPANWLLNADGGNTFGEINSVATLGKAATMTKDSGPQQDTDGEGRLTDASLYMPPPKGVGTNKDEEGADNGLVTSLGELGYVFTGNVAAGAGVPWRSIRLQPSRSASTKALPDWALLDLFSVLNVSTSKVKEARALLVPHETSVGGRVNLNSHTAPFEEMERSTALRAVIAGSPGLGRAGTAAELAQNIYQRRLASAKDAAGRMYGHAEVFDLTGELCEVAGMADAGEESESLIRDVASLFTTRGGAFSIYIIAQALVQTPRGELAVTAERRQHAIVERYLDRLGTVDPKDDEVRFRTVYFRNLSP